MHKKVLPFPAPQPHVDAPIACHHTRVNVRVGTQNFAIDITAQATILPSEPRVQFSSCEWRRAISVWVRPWPWVTALTVGESAGWVAGIAAKWSSW
jgi:hypothetical protein